MSIAVLTLVAVASALAFYGGALAHGRALRREREAMGFVHVSFERGDENPQEVVALWRADRWRFLVLSAVCAPAFGVAVFVLTRSLVLTATAVIGWAPTAAFLACAAWSTLRTRRRRERRLPS